MYLLQEDKQMKTIDWWETMSTIPGLLPYNVTVVHAELTVFTMSADSRTWVASHQKAEVTNNKNDVDLTQTNH